METSQLRSFSLAAFLAAGSLTAGQLYADPSIVNGSFEDPAEAPGTITNVKTVTVPGWFGSSLGSEYIVAGNYDDYGTTAFGSQYLGLNGFRILGWNDLRVHLLLGGSARRLQSDRGA